MNKKTCIVVTLVIILAFLGYACRDRKESVDVNVGVYGSGDSVTYVVNKGTAEITDLFNLTGDICSAQTYLQDFSGAGNSRLLSAQYARVEEGGWVAWDSDQFAYTPRDLDDDGTTALCNRVMFADEASGMTLDRAKTLIPCINMD